MLYLESPPPSVWKASGLDPSFMNFMAEAEMKNKYPNALLCSASFSFSLPLLDDNFSAAQLSSVCVCVLLAYISRLLCLLLPLVFIQEAVEEKRRRPGEQTAQSQETHTGSERKKREREMVWFGEERGGGINWASLLRSGYYAGVGGSSSCVAWSFLFSKFSVELVAGERFSSLS